MRRTTCPADTTHEQSGTYHTPDQRDGRLRGYGDLKSVTSAHSERGLHSSTAANPQRADGLVTLARDRSEEVDPRNEKQLATHHIDFTSIDPQ